MTRKQEPIIEKEETEECETPTFLIVQLSDSVLLFLGGNRRFVE